MTSAIATVMRPLARFYDDPATVELRMTKPGQVIVDRRGEGKKTLAAPDLTIAGVEDICRSLANVTGVKFHVDEAPKLSCIVPEVRHRFECLLGASVQSGISLAIRCKHPFVPTWEQVGGSAEVVEYLKGAMDDEKNIIISGATNTGKTTLLNKLLEYLPDDRRVVAIEDTPELQIDRFWDGVGLLAARDSKSSSGMIGWDGLYDHVMRATPDNVLFGEISIQNAFAALAALNSGATGVLMSIHANRAKQVLTRKFEQNIAWSGADMPRVSEFLHEMVDVVVQIQRASDGFRRIVEIYEPKNDDWVMRDGELQECCA